MRLPYGIAVKPAGTLPLHGHVVLAAPLPARRTAAGLAAMVDLAKAGLVTADWNAPIRRSGIRGAGRTEAPVLRFGYLGWLRSASAGRGENGGGKVCLRSRRLGGPGRGGRECTALGSSVFLGLGLNQLWNAEGCSQWSSMRGFATPASPGD